MNQSPSHNTDALASLCPPCPNKPRSEARALQSHVRLDALLRPRPCRAPHLSPLLGPDPYLAVVPLLRAQGACEGPGGRPSTCAGMPPSVRARMMPTWAQPLRQQEDGAGSQRHRAARTPGTAVPFHPTPQCLSPAHATGRGAKMPTQRGSGTLSRGSQHSASSTRWRLGGCEAETTGFEQTWAGGEAGGGPQRSPQGRTSHHQKAARAEPTLATVRV